MAEVKWTADQQKVIDTRGKNILVSAAAGSGKTAVLSERVIKKCTEGPHPVDVDQILVLTFTRAAAGEMKERIYQKFADLSAENPGDKNLRRQLTLIHNAKITTIDSFCSYIYKNYFEDIGADPDLRLMDEAEGMAIRDRVLNDLLEKKHEEKDPVFLKLCAYFSAREKNTALSDAVLSLADSLGSVPWPEEYLDQLKKPYEMKTREELLASGDLQFLSEYVSRELSELLPAYRDLAELYSEGDKYGDFFRSEEEDYGRILKAGDILEKAALINTLQPAKRKFPSKSSAKLTETDLYAKDLRGDLKQAGDLLEKLCQNLTPEGLLSALSAARPCAEELIELTREFYHAFLEEKFSEGVMDFSDCEHMALSILIDEKTGKRKDAALELSDYFEEIMVDEYQDSNELQETILKSIVTETDAAGNYFMVGDVKQSIYRFRSADPEIFGRKLSSFHEDGGRDTLIRLDKNFRSRRAVIDSVNRIFFSCMASDVGGVDYSEAEALKAGASFPPDTEDNRTEVLLADKPDEGEGQEELDDSLQVEAGLLARRISELMQNFRVTDKETKELRPLRYGDIAVLTRSTSSTYGVISEAFETAGIPFIMVEKDNYLESYEVRVITSLLSLIDNPRDDIALATVLKSPLAGFTDEKLLTIRNAQGEGYFFAAVRLYAEQHPEDSALNSFFSYLGKLRKMSAYTPIHSLLAEIYSGTGFYDRMRAMPGGEVRGENLLRLFDLAVAYEKNAMKGLFGFLRFVEKQKEYTLTSGGALEEGAVNAVRFMTIHKSKGLEFPVVFVFGCGKRFLPEKKENGLYLTKSGGLYMAAFDEERRLMSPLPTEEIARKREQGKSRGEALRVLYVALTRAREKLIITGTIGKADDTVKALNAAREKELPLSFAGRMEAGSFLSYILPAAAQNPALFSITEQGISDMAEAGEKEEESLEKRQRDLLTAEKEYLSSESGKREGERLSELLDTAYPYADEVVYKTKYSVSEIKDLAFQEELSEGVSLFPPAKEEDHLVPKFLGGAEKSPRGAEKGTAMHRFLECFNFAAENFADSVDAERARMVGSSLLTADEDRLLDSAALSLFIKSPLARRMHEAAAKKLLFREKAFVMEKEASGVLPDGGEEPILIQGIIDAYFFEGNDIILLDYKTDRVKKADVLKARYESQLSIYGEALERAYGKTCRERIIYSLTLSQEIKL